MSEAKYVIVLDFNSGVTSVYPVFVKKDEGFDLEAFLENEGFQLSNCEYMLSNKIKFH
jgi:hypothetical protein